MTSGEAVRSELKRRLAVRPPRRVEPGAAEASAAVLLLLRQPPEDGELPGPAGGSTESAGAAGDAGPASGLEGPAAIDRLQGLFVQRAEIDGDPWSGHMALPGGRSEATDRDLAATALRELAEETGLAVDRPAILGRLDDVHPRSRRLPSIAVSPFVAWAPGPGHVRENVELAGHVWVPVGALRSPERRTTLRLERAEAVRMFPAIDYEGRIIWGLTYRIVAEFLHRIGDTRARAARGHRDG